jgi:hypothetical protein
VAKKRSHEETSAWLDHDALKEQDIEQEVEAELIGAGGFGQNKERGVRRLQKPVLPVVILQYKSSGHILASRMKSELEQG